MTRIDSSTSANSTYPKVAVQWLIEALCFYSSSVLVDSEVLNSSFVLLMRLSAKNPAFAKLQNVKCNIFSELTQKASLLFFRLIFLKKLAENFCVISEI